MRAFIPSAVIFDMDGLMFDTEAIGVNAWLHISEEMNVKVTKELSKKLLGITWEASKRILFNELGEFDFEHAQKLFFEYLKNYIKDHGVPIKSGLFELLDFLDEMKIKKAVATSSLYDDAVYYIKKAGIFDRFDEIVTGDMVEKGKPNPDIFLYAAKILDVVPENCIVLEDSINGIKAAHAAKMIPVMIPDLVCPTDEIIPLLHSKLHSLNDVIRLIMELWKD